jgi:lipoprotein Spr
MKRPFHISILLVLMSVTGIFAAAPKKKELRSVEDLAAYYSRYEIQIDSCSNIELYRRVYHYLGTPYRSRSRKGGFDCSGFTRTIYKEVYARCLRGGSADIFPKTRMLAKEELMEGDMVFFKIRKGRISHVGVYLGNGKFAHAATKGGVRIDSLEDPYYKRSFFHGGRI